MGNQVEFICQVCKRKQMKKNPETKSEYPICCEMIMIKQRGTSRIYIGKGSALQ